MKSVLLATSQVIWALLCLVYLISTVVRSGYEMGRYHLEKKHLTNFKTKPYSKGKMMRFFCIRKWKGKI
jgi:hypothetical protein